jgi:hypothetical protein
VTFRLATAPRFTTQPNEDFAAVGADTAVLLDGSGIPEEFDKGCVHGVAWFTRRVGAMIMAEATDPDNARLSPHHDQRRRHRRGVGRCLRPPAP